LTPVGFGTYGPGPNTPLDPMIGLVAGGSTNKCDRELVDVVWRRFGQHVFLTFGEGGRDHKHGDLIFATALAEQAGLGVIQSSPVTAHWIKDAEYP